MMCLDSRGIFGETLHLRYRFTFTKESSMAKGKMASKSEIIGSISESTELTKKQVSAVLEALAGEIKKGLKGAGMFAIPGLVKIEKKKVAAKPARKNVPNPFK